MSEDIKTYPLEDHIQGLVHGMIVAYVDRAISDRVSDVRERLMVPLVIPPMPAVIAEAISKVMAAIGIIEKKGFNQEHKYKFVAIGDILAKLAPAMAAEGLIIMQEEHEIKWVNDGKHLWITYLFSLHHKSGVAWQHKVRQTGVSMYLFRSGGIDDKAVNKCHTAARKYFELALFQIATGDIPDPDDDGETRDERPAKQVDTVTGTGAPMESEGAPPPPPSEPRKKMLAADWQRNAKQEVNEITVEDALTHWEAMNAETLTKLKGADPRLFDELMETIRYRHDYLASERKK